ncbi:MAG: sulfatase-like hydrolase/transferase, partial [bacterium]|nr:sulfatase-like hydrolase/transferase [bacterium]
VLLSLDEAGGKSWYYYIHAMGPHDPYEPPAPYDQTFARDKYADDEEQARRQRLLDLYDGEILYTDLQFGRLIGGLKARGLYDNTLIIVVADHGEEFWEHGDEGHGKTLYEEQLRIPFLMKLPGSAHAGETLEELVEMVDIAPTVLEMIGLPPQPRFQGRSLAHYIESGELDPQPGYANLELHGKNLVTVKTPRDKMIEDRTEHRVSWYDLEVDPGEHAPSSEAPERAVHLPRHAEDVEMGTVQGLHLLVTFAAGDETRLRGCLEGEGLASHRVHAPIREARASREESHVLFSALPGADDGDEEMTRADYMHLFVSMWPSAQVTLTLEADNADGEPVELFVAGMGEDAEAVLLDGPLDLNALTAPPQVINPAGLPRETKAYLWYVMPGQELTEEEVPEETLKALEALGYVD